MRVVLQRVSDAELWIAADCHARIQQGLVLLVGFGPDDDTAQLERATAKLLACRVFADDGGRMNRNVVQAGGEVLVVPNFTLYADTQRGTRPGFSQAAAPERARRLFAELLGLMKARYARVQAGVFGADMQLRLCNDGPVTLICQF